MKRLTLAIFLAMSVVVIAPAISASKLNAPGISQIQAGQSPFFQDSFSGSAIDSTKWNSSFATGGQRWCSSTVANHEDNPGVWLDPSSIPCQGITQNPPFASISVGGGSATFSSFYSRAAPYIWSGPPSKTSPFPSTGNFVLEVKMRYNQFNGFGDGMLVTSWSNTNPVGNNPPGGQQRVLAIWGDSRGLTVQLLGNESTTLADQFGLHDYFLEYVNGKYSLFVDGISVLVPITSSVRPNTIWIGNPVFTFWGVSNWSSFSLNLVRVSTPLLEDAPAQGPIGTKVLVTGEDIPAGNAYVSFDDIILGRASVSNGTFEFTMDIPIAQPGPHQIKAIDLFSGILASTNFTVTAVPGNLSLTLSTGTLYFPGDTASVNLLATVSGAPAPENTSIQLTLITPNNSTVALNTHFAAPGLFRASYQVPKTGPAGTYTFVAIGKTAGAGEASALATFEVKQSWLSQQGPAIATAGVGSLATIGMGLVLWRKGYLSKSTKRPVHGSD
jgi:MG2 domain